MKRHQARLSELKATMIVNVSTHSATIFGANATFSLLGDYLGRGLKDYGSLVAELNLAVYFRGGTRYPESLYEKHHAILTSLPNVRVHRKRSAIEIKYETAVTDARFLERHGFPSTEFFLLALNEAREKLHLMDDRITKHDNFDLARFHADISKLIADAPTTDGSLRAIKADLDLKEQARLAAMDPWQRLGIDWDDYHPNARSLLNDPFFWSEINDSSPHGNDTGSDLLRSFAKWNRRHPNHPAHRMAAVLLQDWKFRQIDLTAIDESAVSCMLREDSLLMAVSADAIIAAAFASLKLRGCCDHETRRFALAAIERERMPSVIAARGWKNGGDRVECLDLMKTAMLNAPPIDH